MSDILELIDGAIWDYGDAMRWSPEPVKDDLDEYATAATGWTIQDETHIWTREMVRRATQLLFEYEPTRVGHAFRPDSSSDSQGRVPYAQLTEAERQALHQWCITHRVDYKRVPIDPLIEHDTAVNEWRIETYRQRGGKCFLGADGEIARAVLRRAVKAELPWRRP